MSEAPRNSEERKQCIIDRLNEALTRVIEQQNKLAFIQILVALKHIADELWEIPNESWSKRMNQTKEQITLKKKTLNERLFELTTDVALLKTQMKKLEEKNEQYKPDEDSEDYIIEKE